ncbi:LysR family transcriptional regulator [Paenibacillus glacialis]|uniref:LysR family transcriptional regulator n=1 Tax=Paenibacillus glacialis TaxID=494026 RepID=A0A168NLL8_9BACL|nr:LysR family transcriptional regulator [Paenibacillus glacialis]OAB45913.1 LysR family transcriptional regulator [Paenibacillus glacialis]
MFESLDVFAIVVEQSSLNKASKLLNLSQPALSRKIAKLENDLGVSLFHRRGKRLELTSIGHLTYTFALEQNKHQQQFLRTLSQHKDGSQISVTLGASLTTLQTTLPPLINTFMERHPTAEIKLVTGRTHEIVSALREKKIDVGIVASSIYERGLNCIPLFEDHLELVLPIHHPLAESKNVNMKHLHGLPMIIFSSGTWYRKLTDELFQSSGILPDIRMEIDSFEAIVRLLPTCNAVTLLPKSYLHKQLLDDNELTVKHIPDLKETRRTTSLIYGEYTELSKAARQWIEETESLFKSLDLQL